MVCFTFVGKLRTFRGRAGSECEDEDLEFLSFMPLQVSSSFQVTAPPVLYGSGLIWGVPTQTMTELAESLSTLPDGFRYGPLD